MFDIRPQILTRRRFSYAGTEKPFGNAIFECGDASVGRVVVCPDAVWPMPMDDEIEV
jgi:hypothetical protein